VAGTQPSVATTSSVHLHTSAPPTSVVQPAAADQSTSTPTIIISGVRQPVSAPALVVQPVPAVQSVPALTVASVGQSSAPTTTVTGVSLPQQFLFLSRRVSCSRHYQLAPLSA